MHGRSYKLGLSGLAIALLVVAGFLQPVLNRQRAALGLTRIAPLENAPPVLAFTTVALGSFRGLIANALWIRASDLQDQDKYFEQVQLSSWITKLEPHFVQVWLVQAWNMAYNISVKFPNAFDRWRWVQRGIELLRDDGIRYNPREPLLYRELAWFFQHKMGQNLDDAHLLYKYEWGNEITNVLGGIKPNYEALLNPRTAEERNHVRVLREKLKMDPAVMQEVDKLYGPLEWRLPEASAIYWAQVGLQKCGDKDVLPLRRVIYQSLQMSVLRGRIVRIDPVERRQYYGPDLAKIPAAVDGYEKMIADEADKPDAIQRAYRNFLREAVYLLYTHNRLQEAGQWFAYLKKKFPEVVPKDQTLEEYGLQRMVATIGDIDHNRTKAYIEGMLTRYFENLAVDEDDAAAGYLLRARRIWDYYESNIQRRQGALGQEPFDQTHNRVRDELLDPQSGFPPEYIARLRTKLGLPSPAPSTNSPPAAPGKSGAR
jgi:hypothetical protein